ncbi:hypothetical protein DP187_01435 [Enterobacter cloacae]|nr:hypothetical protein DP187_01435 [Enterobacter cloacae]
MSTITKQLLQQKIADMEATRDEIPFGLDEDDSNTLASLRIALASLEAEPVGYLNRFTGRVFTLEEQPGADTDAQVYVPVYAAPPAPECLTRPVHPRITSEELDDETLDELIDFRRSTFEYHSQQGNKVQTIIHGVTLTAILELRERRAAMLQVGGNSESPTTLKTAPALDSLPTIAESTSGNSPVIPDGWVLVPMEPTEEMCDVGHVGVDVLTGVTDENEYYSIYGESAAKVYRAMIAVAPQQEAE